MSRLSCVHAEPTASSRLLLAAQLHRLAAVKTVSTLSALRGMKVQSGERRGCLRWYLEEPEPVDTDAAFVVLGLIPMWLGYFRELATPFRKMRDGSCMIFAPGSSGKLTTGRSAIRTSIWAIWSPEGLWEFWQWERDEKGIVRSQPAADRRSVHLRGMPPEPRSARRSQGEHSLWWRAATCGSCRQLSAPVHVRPTACGWLNGWSLWRLEHHPETGGRC